MNRIREIRDAAGLTQEQLAERVGTTANSIWRLESGLTRLTQHWMIKLGEALGCVPAALISNVAAAECTADVEAGDSTPVSDAIASRGFRVYRVTARSVVKAGYEPGDTITVDETEYAAAHPRPLDIVLVEVDAGSTRVLRQFVPPSLLVTNRSGSNLAINLDDPTVKPQIIGVVLPKKVG